LQRAPKGNDGFLVPECFSAADPVRTSRGRTHGADAAVEFDEPSSLLADEHFSVDGTLIEAWASQKSFRPKDGSGDDDGGANFHGQKRKNDTHASTTDPDCRLYRKAAGREPKLCYMGHATMENRHGLAVAGMVTLANGTAERRASETMLKAKAKKAGHRQRDIANLARPTALHDMTMEGR
jgi:hypothetical protein